MSESDRDELKVTDKRRFSTEGESKAEQEAPKEEPAPEEPRKKEERGTAAEKQPPPPLDFNSLILSLANTALFQLGFIKPSEFEEAPKDLPAARQTIDIIALLEEKTRGNLTDQEQKIIKETLFQLRMAFVEASK
jgi:hypothetical protein